MRLARLRPAAQRRLVDGVACPVLVLPRGVDAPLKDLLAEVRTPVQ